MRGLFLSAVGSLMCGAPALAAETIDLTNHPENVWVKQSPREGAPAPGFGWEGSADFDPYTNLWIHYGGHDSNPQGFPLFVWDLKTGVWRQRFPNTSPPGVCCVDGGNVFDRANRRFIRFPGASMNHGWQWSRKVRMKASHVWTYDPVTNLWTNMRPAPYKEPERYSRKVLGTLDPCGAYDPVHEVALSFGGQGSAGGMNNLFVYDTYANHLEQLAHLDPPSPRDGSGFTYDAKNDCIVLFGSQYLSDEKTYIYRYHTNKWEAHDLTPRPPGKKEYGPYSSIPKMAFDSLHGICLCVVWLDRGGHETWAFDTAALKWTKLSPKVEPDQSMSRSRNLAFVAEHNIFIMETMAARGGPQIWTYRYKKAPVDPRPAPPTDLRVVTSDNAAVLTWSTTTSRALDYNVYRAEAPTPIRTQYAKIATVKTTSFEDKGLTPGTVYFYKVSAVAEGLESTLSWSARTQPRVLLTPVVSVLAANKVQIDWNAHPAKDLAGYNLYRGLVTVGTTVTARGSFAENSPAAPEPAVSSVRDITNLAKLNDKPLTETTFTDTAIDLTKKGPESADYKYAVYAYIVKAVNNLGTESGPSPYALTIPAEVSNLLCRERGPQAELKWDPSAEKGVVGYRVYRMGAKDVAPLTPAEPVKATTFTAGGADKSRFLICAVDVLGQEGQPSSPAWYGWSYRGFFDGEWHQ
jgi:hypothetical protein